MECWNPWHGCRKLSPGCAHCYVYRIDERHGKNAGEIGLNREFELPLKRRRDGSWRIPPGSLLSTCFTSDFLLQEADEWRPAAWEMMRQRSDLTFLFFTKRIDRLEQCVPPDWGEGYPNVCIGCSVENQDRADYRLPIFMQAPIRYKLIICAPLLGPVDLSPYLGSWVQEVSVGGESGPEARLCDYRWILDLHRQCWEREIPFTFHQTGALFRKNGRVYRIPRRFQHTQARKAGLSFGQSLLSGKPGSPEPGRLE